MKSPDWFHKTSMASEIGMVDRLNEIVFGLIMVLTFTCSISAATAGREELSTILWSALGCNVAWGIVDALMFLFSVMLERGETLANFRMIRNAPTEELTRNAVKDALPFFISNLLTVDHLAHLGSEIKNLPEPPARVHLTLRDFGQAFYIFLLVFVSTFPVTLPFLLSHNVMFAMRMSNTIALFLLFLTGTYLAKQTGRNKILTGLTFALIGSVLVFVTMALGG